MVTTVSARAGVVVPQSISGTTCRTTATLRTVGLHGTNESTHELSVNVWSQRFYIDTLLREKFPRILCAINPGRLDFDLLKSGCQQLGAVFIFFKGPSDAANPEEHACSDVGQNLSASDHVGDGKPPPLASGPERPPATPSVYPLKD